MNTSNGMVPLRPIGCVQSPRVGLEDDFWGDVESVIALDPDQFQAEALIGLTDFSHAEVLFLMHLVAEPDIQTGARHPRERADWPSVGIFAQRGKARPNRLGVSRCEVIDVQGLTLRVRGLDAVNGTPVLDVKPYMAEFGPRGVVRQPHWSQEIMADYYRTRAG